MRRFEVANVTEFFIHWNNPILFLSFFRLCRLCGLPRQMWSRQQDLFIHVTIIFIEKRKFKQHSERKKEKKDL